jgi:anti-sigma regulatory factor (Ser/Thr protein kinase)
MRRSAWAFARVKNTLRAQTSRRGINGSDVGETTFFPLPRSPNAAALSRERTRSILRRWGAPATVIADAVLGASELVSNAVLYGSEPIGVSLTRTRDTLRVAVQDGNPQTPVIRDTSPDDPHGGRGLHIVAAVSRQWGCQVLPKDGKSVWFCLTMTPSDQGAQAR